MNIVRITRSTLVDALEYTAVCFDGKAARLPDSSGNERLELEEAAQYMRDAATLLAPGLKVTHVELVEDET